MATVNVSNQATVLARVKQCIVDAIGVPLSPSKIPDDMALLDKGLGLDSVSLLRLVSELEQEFGMQIEESAIRPELFRSIGTLSAYVEEHIQGDRASAKSESAEGARR